jgi:hypothetical protein
LKAIGWITKHIGGQLLALLLVFPVAWAYLSVRRQLPEFGQQIVSILLLFGLALLVWKVVQSFVRLYKENVNG